MGWVSVGNRRLWRETLLALVVLALAFLNFGHTSAVFAAGGRIVVTASSVCGDAGSAPLAGDHFACHGCRPDLAALPPAPCAARPIVFAVVPVVYAASVAWAPIATASRSWNPRGPPAI